MKKIILKATAAILASFILISGMVPETAYAKSGSFTCIYKSCNKRRYGSSVYCKDHTSYAKETPCHVTGCTRKKQKSSSYCDYHYNMYYGNKKNSSTTSNKKKSYSSSKSSKKSSYYDSYDDGYEDIWLDDDYDDDRYERDDDYALGVDDAMEDEDW